jgi:predicted nucleotidyltransferase
MISDIDKNTIIDLAYRYKIRLRVLFGSSVDSNREANDIYLAVEGMPEDQFFKFYRELYFSLSNPVDLVDIDKKISL